MKYTVKVNLFTQKDVSNTNSASGSNTPVQLESVQAYKIVTDIVVPGSGSLTPNALKTQLRNKFELVSPISESLSANGNLISGSAGIKERRLEYNATTAAPASGSN